MASKAGFNSKKVNSGHSSTAGLQMEIWRQAVRTGSKAGQVRLGPGHLELSTPAWISMPNNSFQGKISKRNMTLGNFLAVLLTAY